MHSRLARDRYFNDFFRYISNSGQFSKTRQFIQHGDTSVYSHCVAVAYVSLWFSYRLHISVSKQSLLMGAFYMTTFFMTGMRMIQAIVCMVLLIQSVL